MSFSRPGSLMQAAVVVFFMICKSAIAANCVSFYGVPGLTDSDGDGIADSVEGTTDFDGDGIPNHLDQDSDNDKLSDQWEHGVHIAYATDVDGDGVQDFFDNNPTDFTNTCLADLSDRAPADLDNDGRPDFLDPVGPAYTEATDPCRAAGGYFDRDRDFIADIIEGNVDTDGDGLPDYMDFDSDNDNILDRFESGFQPTLYKAYDDDQDGFANIIELQPDNHQNLCLKELIIPADTNGSGVADYLESPVYAPDTDVCGVDGMHSDADRDFIPDYIETDLDTDQDGIPNFMDIDSDNDGILDYLENLGFYESYWLSDHFSSSRDIDQDGLPKGFDSDDNDRSSRCIRLVIPPVDVNSDGIYDFLDADLDDDGLLDGAEWYYGGVLKLDADNDMLTDVEETLLGTNPGQKDTDFDGHLDAWEIFLGEDALSDTNASSIPVDQDEDNDGVLNTFETLQYGWPDSDFDGLSDANEAGFPDANNDGIIDDLTDVNRNGIPDVAEANLTPRDSDGDGAPDFLDLDSDQDSVPDSEENQNLADLDFDGDGLINSLDLDSDGDGLTDLSEAIPAAQADGQPVVDSDEDGRVDGITDLDGDGIPDSVDHSYLPEQDDSDQDGIVDDADIDNLEPTFTYDAYGYAIEIDPSNFDTDGDGIINERDPDPNGTGNPDYAFSSGAIDNDGDGAYAWLDYDDNNAAVIKPPQTANAQPDEPEVQPGQSNPGRAAEPVSGGSGGGGSYGWVMILLSAVLVFVSRRRAIVRLNAL